MADPTQEVSTSKSDVLNASIKKISAEAVDKLDSAFQISYLSSQGHLGKILCVDGSDGLDYVVTGGEDSTARVWHYDSAQFACYRLASVLEHDDTGLQQQKVTSISCAGEEGPVVTGTDQGYLFIWCLMTGARTEHTKEIEAISDLDAKRGVSGTRKLLLAYAVGLQAKLIEAERRDASANYDLHELSKFPHDSPVIRIQHVPGAIHEGAAIATCASDNVMLWNLEGQLLHKLQSSDGVIRCFTISPLKKDDLGWIMAGGSTQVSLWPLRSGRLIGRDNSSVVEVSPAPLEEYQIAEGVLDVAIDPENHFIVVTRMDSATMVTMVVPEVALDALGDEEPGNLLVRAGRERNLFEIPHAANPTEMCVYRDDDDGSAMLIVGLENGTCQVWDLQGKQCGEQSAELRSTTWKETLLPLALMFVTFIQEMSFAFGPATSWKEEVKAPMKLVHEVALFDIRFVIEIDKRLIFWPEAYAAVSVIILFIFLSATGTPEKLRKMSDFVRRSEGYRAERLANRLGCMHLARAMLSGLYRLIALFLGTCSTIFVVPMFSFCAKCVDCIHPPDGSPAFLAASRSTLCYRSEHLILVCTLGVLLPCYFVLLIPHAVVSGDLEYVKQNTLCSVEDWQLHAVRKATLNEQGPVHPLQAYVFKNKGLQLCAKIALPMVAILTTSKPIFQTVAISCIGFLMFINSIRHPPLVNSFWNAVIQGWW